MSAIYMDYAATTPVDPRVAQAMMECLTLEGCFGNPSSTGHSFGSQARARVEKARQQVAALLKCEPTAIVWTSGATESNNLSILGAARYNARTGAGSAGHIVTSRTEHKAVLDPCKQLEKEGFRITWLKPDAQGIVSPAQVAEALAPDTLLVSLMHVNNEIGVIQDIAAVGRLCRERAVLFHVDAAQSAGKLPIDVGAMNVDLLSMTAHKFYGPKGAGALYVRRKPRVGIAPLMFGGGQESGLRSGTLATHQIVGLGAAAALAAAGMENDARMLSPLRQRLWDGLASLGGVHLNSALERSIPHLLNVSFEGV
jgi:cysteine desulfurase